MELILNNIGLLLQLIVDNFWQLIVIFTLLSNKYSWVYGVTLLMVELVIGFKWWIYAIVIVFAIVSVSSTLEYKKEYKKE